MGLSGYGDRMHYRTYMGRWDERRAKPGNRCRCGTCTCAGEVGGMGESLSRHSEMVSIRMKGKAPRGQPTVSMRLSSMIR